MRVWLSDSCPFCGEIKTTGAVPESYLCGFANHHRRRTPCQRQNMPITPKEALEFETEEEKCAFKQAIVCIDVDLQNKFQGGEIAITLPDETAKSLSKRMRRKLEKAYKNAGWQKAAFKKGKNIVNNLVLSDGRPAIHAKDDDYRGWSGSYYGNED